MKFEVIKDKSKLEGTVYFEFLPGKYMDKCWNDNSIFLDEDSMAIIEDLFYKNIKAFDHYDFCEALKDELEKLIFDLKIRITDFNIVKDSYLVGERFSQKYYQELDKEINKNRSQAILMIQDLIDWFNKTLKEKDIISILGI